MPPRRISNPNQESVRRLNRPHGTLGEASDESSITRLTRSSQSTVGQLSSFRNPYEVYPTTSKDARARGELELTNPADQHELPRAQLSGAARRKKKTFRQRQLADLRAMIKLQKNTKLQIPRAPFSRIVREITMETSDFVTHYTPAALEALQEATEMFLTQVLQDAYLLTLHRRCITLALSDMILIRSLKFNI